MKKNLAIVLLAVCLCVAVVVSLNSVNAKKTEIDKLQQSVTQLQKDFDVANAQIAALEGEKAALQTDVDTEKAAVEAANAQIAALEGEKAALQAKVDAILPSRILTIERAAFSVTNGMLQYSFVVYNADKEAAVENPQFLVWIYNGDGDVIHEEILMLDTIGPDQRVVYESEVVEMAQATGGALEQILTVK